MNDDQVVVQPGVAVAAVAVAAADQSVLALPPLHQQHAVDT
jgi:hypothetical protein